MVVPVVDMSSVCPSLNNEVTMARGLGWSTDPLASSTCSMSSLLLSHPCSNSRVEDDGEKRRDENSTPDSDTTILRVALVLILVLVLVLVLVPIEEALAATSMSLASPEHATVVEDEVEAFHIRGTFEERA